MVAVGGLLRLMPWVCVIGGLIASLVPYLSLHVSYPLVYAEYRVKLFEDGFVV